MTPFLARQQIEKKAVGYWHKYGLQPGFDIERLVDQLDLGILWESFEPVDGRAIAAELIAGDGLIRLNEDERALLTGNLGFFRFTVAHEIGHWDLHAAEARADSVPLLLDLPDRVFCRPVAFGNAVAPSSFIPEAEARREHQAHLFASYLLAPTDVFMSAFRSIGCDGWAATLALADGLGLSGQATLVRLSEQGLGHRDSSGIPRPGLQPRPGQASFDF